MSTYDDGDTYQERSSSSGCLKGCLIAAVIVILIALGVVVWVMLSWKGWVADFTTEAVGVMIDESDWPDQEKLELKAEVERLGQAFRNGDLSGDQLLVLMEEIADSPLMTTMVVAAIETKYVDDSGLSDEEKEAGRVALRRFVRGMINDKISEDDLDEAMRHIADKGPDGEWELRESVSDDELRKLFEIVEAKADEAGIPEEVEEVDPSDELRRIIDEALAGGGQAEAETEAEPEPEAEAEPELEPEAEAEPVE